MVYSSSIKKTGEYLPEIDGLRAVAILAVIFNHYFEEWLESGFEGVDVFFVISGFVISKYLHDHAFDGWRDYLVEFYSRRIKRLLPALLFCVFFTSLLFLVLTTRPSPDAFVTGGLAIIGCSNVFLWMRSTDYFSLDAQLNPFTHTWSLGVEEQFYLVFPVLFACAGFVAVAPARRERRLWILTGLTVLSFLCYLVLLANSETAAFYLILGRLWELGAGSLACLACENRKRPDSGAFIPAVLLVLIGCLFTAPVRFQAFTTIASVLLTALLIVSLRPGNIAYRILAARVPVFIGKISYSLYLWHWSLLVLGRWTIGETPAAKCLCLLLTALFSLFSYCGIERPLRYASWTGSRSRTIALGLWIAALLALLEMRIAPQFAMLYNPIASRLGVADVEPEKNLDCNVTQSADDVERCLAVTRTARKPNAIYLIGDSHAAQLVAMMTASLQSQPYSLRFFTTEDTREFPRGLIYLKPPMRTKTLDYIAAHAIAGDYVVMAFHRGRLNEARDRHIAPAQSIAVNEKTVNFLANVEASVKELTDRGVKIILIRDTPLMRVVSTSPACAFQIKFFGKSICSVTKAQDLHTRYWQDYVYDILGKSFKNVYIWDPLPLVYGPRDSIDVIDDQSHYIMRDWNHITRYQAMMFGENFRNFFQSTQR